MPSLGQEASAAPALEESVGDASISTQVREAAKEIYYVVRALPGTIAEELEGTFHDEYIKRDISVRMIVVSGAWSELAGRSSPEDTLFQYLSERGWTQEPRYSADGPDGTYFAFSKAGIWCFVRGRWDGGDDADSTYVPSDTYQYIVYCTEFDGHGRNDPEDE